MDNNLKKTILNYELLTCELQDAEILSQQYRDQFYNEVYPDSFNNHIEVGNNSPLLNQEIKNEIPEVSESLRKIYKKLSLKTHPDRNINLDEEEQKENEEIFKEISESYQNKDFCNLLVKARELRVKIPELSEDDLKVLDVNIKNIEDKLTGIKKEISWKWCTTTCSIEKRKIKEFVRKIVQEAILQDFKIIENKSCAICLDVMEENNIEKKLPCDHVFHKGCILSWFSIKFQCPLCRRSFE